MKLLLTGGTGYIGSHTAVALLEAGHQVVLYDNLGNSRLDVVERVESITGQPIIFVDGDIRDTALLTKTLQENEIDSVVHFDGLKAVGESVEKPIEYYSNNVQGTISLLLAMRVAVIRTIVFSSSATVYGEPQYLPLDESHPTSAINPYGRCKLHVEHMLGDIVKSDKSWRIACLRYFNPVGAHESGLIGEEPNCIPNNLMPYLAQVAAGKLSQLHIFGDDYLTPDGTGVRDYIHVMDLAEGHLAAINYLGDNSGWHAINLGTGRGYSVLELVETFEKVSGRSIPFQVVERRPGDVASCFAKVDKAVTDLGWKARLNLEDMCESSWRFQKMKRDR